MEGITESMRQYQKTVDAVVKNNPKHGKEYGIKRPESANIVVAIAIIFAIATIIVDVMR
ncbi:MAG: hypothetical protein WB392_05340 [Methanotrichaceae archaeon]